MSSAESELYAATKTGMEALGHQNLLNDMGIEKGLNVHLDSSSALSLTNRKGLGKMKHIEMQHLWVQDAVRNKKFIMRKVHTSENPADLMTKALPADKINHFMKMMGFRYK